MSAPETPDWVRDAVFYQIFPDRFAKSDRVPKPSLLQPWGSEPTPHGYQGGDLLGVAERLDYLSDLGINAIYFTPVFQSASNHRYHTHDYEKVDPMLGGDSALRQLLDLAHDHGIRVVLDGVFNHASRGFLQFNDILENGRDSAYLDWFHIEDFPLRAYDPDKPPNYGAWWNLHALPKFRTETPAVREFLWSIAERWIAFGADGWRLDVPQEINDDAFWRAFRRRVKGVNPDAYIVGEIWTDASRWLQGDMFDAVMNYLFTKACLAFFIGDRIDREMIGGSPLADTQPLDAHGFSGEIERLLGRYHENVSSVLLNLIGSHDTARFLTVAGGDRSAFRLATLFQMTFPGAPCIYYGDEIGLQGGRDPACRGAFPWDESAWDNDLLEDIRRYVQLRHRYRSLRHGSYENCFAEGHVYAFTRALSSETALVVLNAGQRAVTVDLPVDGVIPEGKRLVDQLEDDGRSWTVFEGRVPQVEIAARSGRVFIAEREG